MNTETIQQSIIQYFLRINLAVLELLMRIDR
jgi:hypothetical protein